VPNRFKQHACLGWCTEEAQAVCDPSENAQRGKREPAGIVQETDAKEAAEKHAERVQRDLESARAQIASLEASVRGRDEELKQGRQHAREVELEVEEGEAKVAAAQAEARRCSKTAAEAVGRCTALEKVRYSTEHTPRGSRNAMQTGSHWRRCV
jgi:chromosome segregation ATPase